ncbi:hypothetical protein SELMODRAFT_116037 [Selaginella moellendorffii]|uniref:Uncharacterized protein n=1 Tax=Selaginella moellendorffii TaxID=88036 RepID=D8SFB3_SELML|nr:hypothetical protein SELMODRAFT_116037 [Selaginella moellendorffii]
MAIQQVRCAWVLLIKTVAQQASGGDGDDDSPVFIDQADVDGEVVIDEQDLPDAEEDGDGEEEEEKEEEEDGNEVDDSIHIFTGHAESVYAVACSPVESRVVATGGGDDKIFIWKIGDDAAPLELKEHKDSISSLAFSFDGKLLASGGLDGVVCVWDGVGSLKHRLEGPGEDIVWLCWHPRGHILLAGSQDFSVWMWNADSGACLSVFTGHSGSVICGCFTPDGKLVCTGSSDCSLRVWNPRSGECIRNIQGHPYHRGGVTCVAVGRDSSIALTGSADGSVCLVNIQSGRVLGTLSGHTQAIEAIALSPRCSPAFLSLAATGGRDKKLIVWDLQTLSVRLTCDHQDDVYRIIWSPSSEMIYTACLDGSVHAWDPRSGTRQKSFHGHSDGILDMALTCDGMAIVSGSDDTTARVFEVS